MGQEKRTKVTYDHGIIMQGIIILPEQQPISTEARIGSDNVAQWRNSAQGGSTKQERVDAMREAEAEGRVSKRGPVRGPRVVDSFEII
jgi:hypothetical protein